MKINRHGTAQWQGGIKDGKGAISTDRMHAAHVLNGPNFAHAILTTAELIAKLPGV